MIRHDDHAVEMEPEAIKLGDRLFDQFSNLRITQRTTSMSCIQPGIHPFGKALGVFQCVRLRPRLRVMREPCGTLANPLIQQRLRHRVSETEGEKVARSWLNPVRQGLLSDLDRQVAAQALKRHGKTHRRQLEHSNTDSRPYWGHSCPPSDGPGMARLHSRGHLGELTLNDVAALHNGKHLISSPAPSSTPSRSHPAAPESGRPVPCAAPCSSVPPHAARYG